MAKMPIGISYFPKVIKEGYYFVDKTKFIAQLIDNHAGVTLYARPRRFGKTLGMSMIDSFFNIEQKDEVKTLFEGTYIASAGDEYMSQAGTKPVISLSLKDIKEDTFPDMLKRFGRLLAVLYMQHHTASEQEGLLEPERAYFQRIEWQKADKDDLQDALRNLVDLLARRYRRPVLLLLDEYDAPIQYAWEKGYYDQAISFLRNFLSAAFKDNPNLDFALVTGVLRIAKESIFSGLNNFKVSTVVSGGFADAFGFTREEVQKMAADLHREEKLPEIAAWYDGYDFQGVEIYNPWSVISYFDNHAKAAPYWVNTSGNEILTRLLADVDEIREQELQNLLDGGHVTAPIQESVVYPDIGKNKGDLYTILLLTGYLNCVGVHDDDDMIFYDMAIPNHEIRSIYRREILNKLTGKTGISILFDMAEAMEKGQTSRFAAHLKRIILESVSIYDAAKPESFYHGFMLGLTVWLEKKYLVRSNKESGYGRFDLALIPRKDNLPGIIMEFKAVKTVEELPDAAQKALQQITDKAYATELHQTGVQTVWTYGIAFSGKHVEVAS